MPLIGGHRAFRVRFDNVEVADRSAVLAGPDGSGLTDHGLRRVANAAVALLSLDLVGVGEAVLRLNTDENPQTASRFNISGIPTMLIFKRGKLVDQLVGLQQKPAIAARLARHE